MLRDYKKKLSIVNGWSVCLSYFIPVLAAIFGAAAVLPSIVAPAMAYDYANNGGVVPGATIYNVVNLNDSGTGSLRWALEANGPRLVVFSVGGYIDLNSDISINSGSITVAGQTAPDPGVIVRYGTLRIRDSNVRVEHITVMPGASQDPVVAEKRDGISVYGSPKRGVYLSGIWLRHVSVGWGVDENIGVQGLVDALKVERSLIFDGLSSGGHPKGNHSMNLALGAQVRRAVIVGNLLTGSNWRNPRFTSGNTVSFVNNAVYVAGRKATHIDASREFPSPVVADLIANYYVFDDPKSCKIPMVEVGRGILDLPETKIHISGNARTTAGAECPNLVNANPEQLSRNPAMVLAGWSVTSATQAFADILAHAGARPARRHPIDLATIAKVKSRNVRIIANEHDGGGWPPIPNSFSEAKPPGGARVIRQDQMEKLSRWLCENANQVGDRGCHLTR